jgi:RNA-binding protein YhbY
MVLLGETAVLEAVVDGILEQVAQEHLVKVILVVLAAQELHHLLMEAVEEVVLVL